MPSMPTMDHRLLLPLVVCIALRKVGVPRGATHAGVRPAPHTLLQQSEGSGYPEGSTEGIKRPSRAHSLEIPASVMFQPRICLQLPSPGRPWTRSGAWLAGPEYGPASDPGAASGFGLFQESKRGTRRRLLRGLDESVSELEMAPWGKSGKTGRKSREVGSRCRKRRNAAASEQAAAEERWDEVRAERAASQQASEFLPGPSAMRLHLDCCVSG
jgi:hypothetical protein